MCTTADEFDRGRIKENTWNDLDCPVTYPVLPAEPYLDYPGTIEATIPHDELFPDGSSHKKVEARFVVTVKPKGTLLEAVVYLKRNGRPLLKIKTKLVSAASWVPQSEFDVEMERHDRRPKIALAPPEGERKGKTPKRKRISLKRRNYYDSPISHQAEFGLDSRIPRESLSHREPAATELSPAAAKSGQTRGRRSVSEESLFPSRPTILPRRILPLRKRRGSLTL